MLKNRIFSIINKLNISAINTKVKTFQTKLTNQITVYTKYRKCFCNMCTQTTHINNWTVYFQSLSNGYMGTRKRSWTYLEWQRFWYGKIWNSAWGCHSHSTFMKSAKLKYWDFWKDRCLKYANTVKYVPFDSP